MTYVMDELDWDADRVAMLMAAHQIRNRNQLAKTLGIGRTTLSEAFNNHWQGRATAYLIAVLCSYFKVRIADIVQEPRDQIRRVDNGHMQQIPNRAVS